MQTETRTKTEGYIATKRFFRDYPKWLPVVKACVVEAERTKGEFAGAWVLQGAKQSGIDWFPNLRPLVSCRILRRTDVTRGGRRAYYVMLDVEGVKAALTDIGLELNEAATVALGNAIYRFTFGIIGDARGGVEGRGLGTGIGLRWKNTYLILTAAHTIQETPHERLYFLLPSETLQFFGSRVPVEPARLHMRRRFQLEKPEILLDEAGEDLAAVILDEQRDEIGRTYFYELDEAHATPSTAKQVGFLGYPGATSVGIGENFMATPYLSFGEKMVTPSGYDQDRISVSYPLSQSVDPHGLSGSGLWVSRNPGIIWSPNISLVGLVTDYDPKLQVLGGYKIEKLIQFLKTKDRWMRGEST